MMEKRKPFHWDYSAQPKEHVEACNACGSTLWVTIAHMDRYGFPVTTHCCHSCGLIFLSPRMTKEAYAEFYKGTYRDLLTSFHPKCGHPSEATQTKYAKRIIPLLEPFVSPGPASLLDIGGAPGFCAKLVHEHFGMNDAVVLDPACHVTAHAEPVSFVSGTLESGAFSEGAQFDLILCCQTADHLLDLRGSLEKMRSLLSDDGVLWIDIMDWLYALRKERPLHTIIKIDHPYCLTDAVFYTLLLQVGLKPQRLAYNGAHVGFICKKSQPTPETHSGRFILDEIRKYEAKAWLSAKRK
jgi:SAM-dependent methyltransferase